MTTIIDFMNRAADSCGFRRERYIEKHIPSLHSNLAIMPFFGDMKSEFVLSSLLLHRLIKEVYPGKYFILASWPGHDGLFPYVNEYWGLKDEAVLRELSDNTSGFDNSSRKMNFISQMVNQFFPTVVRSGPEYYDERLTGRFFERFKEVIVSLPSVPSPSERMDKDNMVYLQPLRKVGLRDFWVTLVEALLGSGFNPVIRQDYSTHDLSCFDGRVTFFRNRSISEEMGVMRLAGCALDVFSDTSRLAMAARCPFLAITDRQCCMKDFEIRSLCADELPCKYRYSFTNVLENGSWRELVSQIVFNLKEFLLEIDRDKLPSTGEVMVSRPYTSVKEQKRRHFGARFIKVPRL